MNVKFNNDSNIYHLDIEIINGDRVKMIGSLPENISSGFSFLNDEFEPIEIYNLYTRVLEQTNEYAILTFNSFIDKIDGVSQLDRIEAQIMYTALITDSLI